MAGGLLGGAGGGAVLLRRLLEGWLLGAGALLLRRPSTLPGRLQDGTWHMWPDGCGGWCHYSSPDLFHWTQHAPMPKLGGLTGSLSYTDAGMFLLHPKGGDWIARATPNGTDAPKLDDFDDSSCATTGAGCAATAPNHGNKWPVGLDGNFMDPSRAVKLSDGSWYIVCGAGCMGACKSPRDDGKVGVPWFRAHDSSLKSFELAGYLLNVSSSLGKLSSNQWSNDSLPCHFQACPDVFPLVSRTIIAQSSAPRSPIGNGCCRQRLAKADWQHSR